MTTLGHRARQHAINADESERHRKAGETGEHHQRHDPRLQQRDEVADAAAEEAADLVPAGRDRAAEHRQTDVDPEVPGGAGERPGRDAEVEQRGGESLTVLKR